MSRRERKDLFGISPVILFIEAAELWVEYQLHLLSIRLAKLNDVKKVYASVVLYAICENSITEYPDVFRWISVALSPVSYLSGCLNITLKDSFSS